MPSELQTNTPINLLVVRRKVCRVHSIRRSAEPIQLCPPPLPTISLSISLHLTLIFIFWFLYVSVVFHDKYQSYKYEKHSREISPPPQPSMSRKMSQYLCLECMAYDGCSEIPSSSFETFAIAMLPLNKSPVIVSSPIPITKAREAPCLPCSPQAFLKVQLTKSSRAKQ